MSNIEHQELLAELSGAKNEVTKEKTSISLPSSWKVSKKGQESIDMAIDMTSMKHGLYAAIPMLCRGDACPYATVCPLIDIGMAPVAERCSLEIAMILRKYEEYKDEFEADEKNIVDMGLIKDLIDYDIQLFRAENKIAVQGDFVEDVVVTVTDGGEVITNPQLSKATEYKDRIAKKKHKVLELMNSTRKDKAGTKLNSQMDPSSYAAALMAQAAQAMTKSAMPTIDAEYEDVDSDG